MLQQVSPISKADSNDESQGFHLRDIVNFVWRQWKFSSGFTTPRQIEEQLGLPLLTSISRMEQSDLTVNGKVVEIPLYPTVKPLSQYSEAMRTLRSGIQMTDVVNPPKVIQLTSTLPGEGKTTIALSLAVSTASSGAKVLFIDADLRRSAASRFLGLQKDSGLVDLLLGDANPGDVIRFYEPGQFWLLAAGSKIQNPSDLLGSERMKSFIKSFRQSFDVVVIDSPPTAPVIDAIITSHLADKTVYVVRWAATAREMIQQATKKFASKKQLAGVVFNHVDGKMAHKYDLPSRR
jgi:polysaccharide biosynthesis transport protein